MPDYTGESCKLCPAYGRVWSCPPGLPDVEDYLHTYDDAYVIAVKLSYSEDIRNTIQTREDADKIRKKSFEVAKKRMLHSLIQKEEEMPHALALGAGKCVLCERCDREDGKYCHFPEKRRYSVTSFGFDFSAILTQCFNLELLWEKDRLPEYEVAVSMLFV